MTNIHEIAKLVADLLPGFEYVESKQRRDLDGNPHTTCGGSTAILTSVVWQPAPANAQAEIKRGVRWTDRSMQLVISYSSSQKGKLRIALDVPHVELNGKRIWLGDTILRAGMASIHVSPERTATAIAHNLERRLLPVATDQWASMLSWLEDREAYAAQQTETCEQLRSMGAIFSPHSPAQGRIKVAGDYIAFTARGATVSFDLMTITVEQACQVLQVLGASKAGVVNV